ncbi:hypothetical protein BpHYR1_011103 [Brachionus plicatilis]|uniref:Uncharacterized protein n=1 Tax=Brachionus plicatilis TaxID=10195 RepID=A0A3M7RW05_BRAPC|nr:hypothetical protein BpHYR1_011103 [Brachionus plicatilis]
MRPNIYFKNENLLIEIISKYIIDNGLTDLSGGSRSENNHFRIISSIYSENIDVENAAHALYTRWNRNGSLLKSNVLNSIIKIKEGPCFGKAEISKKPVSDKSTLIFFDYDGSQCSAPDKQSIYRKRICGLERKELQYEIHSKGTGNFWNEATYFDEESKLNIGYDNIRKLSSQHRHRFQLEHDLRIDSDASKNIFDKLLPSSELRGLTGYIQEINSNPFGAILISEIQLKIWSIINRHNSIWYFDATGNIMPKLRNQSEILLFSIVIERFSLYSFFTRPKVVVTDYSWANLHALCRSLNDLEIIDYLNLTFKFLVRNEKVAIFPIRTMIYLCSTHFLKNIIDKKCQHNDLLSHSSCFKHVKLYQCSVNV